MIRVKGNLLSLRARMQALAQFVHRDVGPERTFKTDQEWLAATTFFVTHAGNIATRRECETQVPQHHGEFVAELCAAILNRLNAQHVQGKSTRTKAALHALCGAAQVLTQLRSDHLNAVTVTAVLTSARGIEVVEKTARGEPL